jgi:hypothetical protein
VRDFSFIRLFNGAPKALGGGQERDLVQVAYERNPDILRSELDRRDTAAAMSAYADEIDAHAAPVLA